MLKNWLVVVKWALLMIAVTLLVLIDWPKVDDMSILNYQGAVDGMLCNLDHHI